MTRKKSTPIPPGEILKEEFMQSDYELRTPPQFKGLPLSSI
jgi:hypothetical protein